MIASLVLASTLVWTGQGDARAEIEALIAPWRRAGAPGGAVAVLRDGEVLVRECFGLADFGGERANAPDTPFYVASLAKPFTAACVVHAASKGSLDLDQALTKLFPELPSEYGRATLRQLLHHRSGILDVYDTSIAADLGTTPLRSNAAALELLGRLPQLCFAPGTRMLYSNSGYVLLAEALARATGRDLPTYAREHVFAPAGMQHARYLGEPSGSAKSYALDGDAWQEQRLLTGLRGPGGLYLALDDLVAWERAWRAGTWGTPELRASMLVAPEGWQHPRLGRYAAGWMLQDFDGLRVERHFGGAFGYSADLRRFPDQEVSVIVLSNAADLDASTLGAAIARVVLADAIRAAAHAVPQGIALTAEQRARFGRIWQDVASGEVWIVTPKPDHFVIAALGDIKLELVAESEQRLVARNAQVPFAVELDGAALMVRHSDGSSARLQAVPFPPRDLPPVEDYAGEWVCPALGATIHLEVRGGQLALVQHDAVLEIPPFIGLARDLFLCDQGARMDFERDEHGRPAAMKFSANRAWGLRFVRAPELKR